MSKDCSFFTVLDLLDLELKDQNALHLKCLGGRKGLSRCISVPDLNRPGLALSGFFDSFAADRLQIFGRGENDYLRVMSKNGNAAIFEKLFSFPMPCCIFTHSLDPVPEFTQAAEKANCPILQTRLASGEFSSRVMRVLADVFAPHKTMHAELVDVYGIGILILGNSGIGKSETALELVERGHRLVSDDVVDIRCVNAVTLMGQGLNKELGHHMEIRGLGIINITQLFGVRAIRDTKQIQLVCALEVWDQNKVYDSLGMDEQTMEILGVRVPRLEIPIKPGRNIPILIETAALNERLKKMGHHSAKEFDQNVQRWQEAQNARNYYFVEDGQ